MKILKESRKPLFLKLALVVVALCLSFTSVHAAFPSSGCLSLLWRGTPQEIAAKLSAKTRNASSLVGQGLHRMSTENLLEMLGESEVQIQERDGAIAAFRFDIDHTANAEGGHENIAALKDFLTQAVHAIETHQSKQEQKIREDKRTFNERHGWSRFIPFGPSADLIAEERRAIGKDQALMKRLAALVDGLRTHRDTVINDLNTLASDPEWADTALLFNFFYSGDDFSGTDAIAWVRSLLNAKGSIRSRYLAVKPAFDYFFETESFSVSFKLATASATATPDARLHLKDLFTKLNETLSENEAAHLAVQIFQKKGAVGDVDSALKGVEQIADALGIDTDLAALVLTIFMHGTPWSELPKIAESYKRFYDHANVSDRAAVILLLTQQAISKKGAQQADEALKLFDRFYEIDGVDENASAVLASTVLMVGANATVFLEAKDLYHKLYNDENFGLDESESAAVASSMILKKHRKMLDLLNIEMDLDNQGSSDLFSPIQGALTGNWLNLDGNPFTPW